MTVATQRTATQSAPIRARRGAALILVSAALAGCAAQPRSATTAAAPIDVERCRAAGHQPDTEGFASCLQSLELLRRREALRDQQIDNATIEAQRRAPQPR